MKYVTLYKKESLGSDGSFGLEIRVAASKLPDLKQTAIWLAADKAADLVEKAVCHSIKKDDPKTKIATTTNREMVSKVFPESIFVEEIENGYCKDWCCSHLPWFVVTTKVGRFTIGWRKRVLSISWDETVGTKTSSELFPDESVTKGDKFIHAWSIEDAKRYIDAIIGSIKA